MIDNASKFVHFTNNSIWDSRIWGYFFCLYIVAKMYAILKRLDNITKRLYLLLMGYKSAFIIKSQPVGYKQGALMVLSSRAYPNLWSTGPNHRALESPTYNLEEDYRRGRYQDDKVLGS